MDEPSAALDDADYRAQADFRYAIRRFLRTAEHNARGAGITPQQFLLLLAVRGHPSYPDVSISEIAEYLQVRHHSASLLVERAVRRGLFLRRQDLNDRRRVLVSLSAEGTQILESVVSGNRRELRALDSTISALQASLRRTEGTVPPDAPEKIAIPS